MNFPFDASKTPATGTPAQGTPGGTPGGFAAGTTQAGDAGKLSMSSGFSLGSMQNQAKPGGLFGSGLAGTPAPSFGTLGTPTQGLNLSATAGGVSSGGTSFGALPMATPGGLNFGMGGGTTATTGFGATSFTSGGLGSATATSTPGSSNFGAPQAAATTTTTGFSLGGSTPTSAAATRDKTHFGGPPPSTAFTLGRATITPVTTPIASTGTGFTIAATTASTPQTAISLGSAAPPPPSGFSLIPSTASTSLTSTFGQTCVAPTTTTNSTGFSLGSATTPASTGFSLGSSAAPTISTGFTLNKTTTNQAAATTATTNASQPQTSLGTVTTVSSSNAGQTGSMNFCQLEESINKWTLELEEQEKAFVNQATQVNAWDKLLIANGEKITLLNQEVERVKLEQQQLEHELDYVVGQQKELQDCLTPLEKELASLSVADPERDYTYRLAENLDKQLKQMSQDLKEIIEHLNEANRSQDSSDPIVQIGKILNAHMNSLQWLDQKTTLIGHKIQQIDQMHTNFRQENERSFNLAYN